MNPIPSGRHVFAAGACWMACTTCAAIDLTEAYLRALQADPGQLAADAARQAGREKALQGDALLRPQVGLSLGTLHVDDRSSYDTRTASSELVRQRGSATIQQASLQLKQPLFDIRAVAEKSQLRQQTEMAEVRFRHAQQELMQKVVESYLGVLLAQEAVEVTIAEKAAVTLQRDRAQARFEVGRGRITDLQEAQSRLDGVLAKEVSVRSQLALAQAQFLELTGTEAVGLAPLPARLSPVPPTPDDLRAWQDRSRDTNTRVLFKQHELAIAGHDVSKTTLQARPTLDLVASYSAKKVNGSVSPWVGTDGNRTAVIGVQFSVPLYAGGGIDSKQRESIARQVQAEQELGAARRDARLQVQDAFTAVKTGVARIAALEQSLVSTRTALEATTLGRDLGTRTELDVLDTQQRMYSVRLDLAQARHDYLLGRVRLSAAAGDLQQGHLRELDALLVH